MIKKISELTDKDKAEFLNIKKTVYCRRESIYFNNDDHNEPGGKYQ